MVELTDSTLLELAAKHIGKVPDNELIPDLCKHWPMSTGDADKSDLIAFARAAIAADRALRPTPQPPADGEVAELVAWLREVDRHFNSPRPARAAELLQRFASSLANELET